MPHQAPPSGLYQQLLTEGLEQQLRQLQDTLVATDGLDPQEAPRLLARHLAGLARIALEHLSGGATPEHQLALVNQLVGLLQSQAPRAITTGDLLHPSSRLLSEIRSTALLPGQAETIRPLIPLADSTLLVNASGEPSVGQALIHEIPSAQRIDLLCAFIKWSGLRLLQPALSAFLQAQPRRPLRVLTTVYLGATDRRALDWLVAHGAEVRVSYDTRRTRLHAKAWLFHRPGLSGAAPASTAYIGSSNLSTAALHDGLEWNVRLSAHDNEGILAKFQAAFESYWEEGEFEPYRASELEQRRFDRAVREESAGDSAADATPLSFFDIRPYAYQQEILDKLSAERSLHGRWRNLVVAATGTGKTVVAALDYARQGGPGHPSLLFVAHRREILQQSLATFRQVLRDGSFGELLVDGQRPSQWRHVFASVQSLAGLDPADLAPDTFDVVIVDEFHHAEAPSYTALAGSPGSPSCCWASPPPPSAPAAKTSSIGSAAASPPSCASGAPWSRACCALPLLRPPRRHRPLADRMAPQRLRQRSPVQPLHRRRRPPAPDPARTGRQDHQPGVDAGPGLLRERGARPLDGPQVRGGRPARRRP